MYDEEKWEMTLNSHFTEITKSFQDKSFKSITINYLNIRNVEILVRYNYWKGIRNCCAHPKKQHINNSTVEQFWNYMQDDLCELFISDGEEYLQNELCACYKYCEIESYKTRLPNLLKDIYKVYGDRTEECFKQFFKESEYSA